MDCSFSSFDLRDALNISIGAQDKRFDQLELIVKRTSAAELIARPNAEPAMLLPSSSDSCETVSRSPSSLPASPTSTLACQYLTAETRNSKTPSQYQLPALITSHPMAGLQANRCAVGCACICHTRSNLKSPWILKTLLGEINIQYSGRRQDCKEFNCCRSADSSVIMIYQLPSYLMRRYVTMTMRYAPLDGPQFTLRVPRVMRWSHLLWNYAHNNNLLAVQKMFSERTASPHDLSLRGSNALIYTVIHSDLRLTRFLLETGADPKLANEAGRTAAELLWEGAFAGHFGDEGTCKVQILLIDSDYVDNRGFSTIHKIVIGLLRKDLKSELETSTAALNITDLRGRTPLCWATIRNDAGAVRTLLDYKADPKIQDNHGQTPLDFVRSVAICRLLLDAGVDINARNTSYGRSALHQFCGNPIRRSVEDDSIGVIDMLVHAGLDVDVRDADGETPLLNAIFSGLTRHAQRLIELGANVNIANCSSKDSAILFAVSFNHHEVLPLVLEKGADYKHVDVHRRTIAHLAARSADAKTMRILAESNLVDLDLSLRDVDGKTAADYLAARSILVESEEGLHEEFDRLCQSLRPQSSGANALATNHIDLESEEEVEGHFHLPGAFPTHGDLT